MSALDMVGVYNVPGSPVAHLPSWGSRWGRTLCRMTAVEAAIEERNRNGVATFVVASTIPGVRMCKRCVEKHHDLTAQRDATIAAIEQAAG